jgi:hypothetical protein
MAIDPELQAELLESVLSHDPVLVSVSLTASLLLSGLPTLSVVRV